MSESQDGPARYTSCLDCGEVVQIPRTPVGGQSPDARCPSCRNNFERPRRNREREAVYARASWKKLSRALRREAVCVDCGSRGTPENPLTLDHLPGSHERAGAGLRLRPGVDVEVRCRRHNSSAGPARGPYARLRKAER